MATPERIQGGLASPGNQGIWQQDAVGCKLGVTSAPGGQLAIAHMCREAPPWLTSTCIVLRLVLISVLPIASCIAACPKDSPGSLFRSSALRNNGEPCGFAS